MNELSSESEAMKRGLRVPFWMLWANPILHRYCRSRLRPGSFGVMLLLAVLFAGFIFFVTRSGSARMMEDPADIARMPLIPLLVLQGVILFVLGTGQVAGGMTAEAEEGVLDYQRLAPMKPLSKVVGYLFGLPIREWLLFLATLPFTIWSAWEGEVPAEYVLQLYAVFVMAAILYHLTGLVAGSVMKNRRWAFLSVMGMIFLLYTVVPNASKFGLVYFKYITIYPVLEEVYPFMIGEKMQMAAEAYREIVPQARFFGLNFPQYVFTLFSQGILALAMVVVLWRRWRTADCHLLGKAGATGLFCWLQLMLLGNAIPLIGSGDLFPTREMNRRFGVLLNPDLGGWQPERLEAFLMIGIFGLVTLSSLWWMCFLITPTKDVQLRGWRRARKLGNRRLPVLSDAATAAPWALIMGAIGVVGWYVFAKSIIESRWFPQVDFHWSSVFAMTLVLVGGGLGFQALLEGFGRRTAGYVAILGGVIPVMIAVILAVTEDRFASAAVWIAGVCPVTWPIYGSKLMVPGTQMPRDVAASIEPVFWYWQATAVLATIWLLWLLFKSRRKIAKESLEESS